MACDRSAYAACVHAHNDFLTERAAQDIPARLPGFRILEAYLQCPVAAPVPVPLLVPQRSECACGLDRSLSTAKAPCRTCDAGSDQDDEEDLRGEGNKMHSAKAHYILQCYSEILDYGRSTDRTQVRTKTSMARLIQSCCARQSFNVSSAEQYTSARLQIRDVFESFQRNLKASSSFQSNT